MELQVLKICNFNYFNQDHGSVNFSVKLQSNFGTKLYA